jgi:hypothetical protein
MTPKKLLRILRRSVLVLVLAGGGYLLVRFDGMRLPADAPSPLQRFSPGDSLLMDRYPAEIRMDDPVIYSGPDGRVHLGLILDLRQQDGVTVFRVGQEAPDGVATDSQTPGWMDREWIVGRVIMVWPW